MRPSTAEQGSKLLRPLAPKAWKQQDTPLIPHNTENGEVAVPADLPAPLAATPPASAITPGSLTVTKASKSPTPILQTRRTTMLHASVSDWKPIHPVRFAVVIGTRPEAIKLAPVIAELRARALAAGRPNDVFVCTTGQHQDLVREPLALFNITPDLDLGLMEHGASLATIGARVLDTFGQVLAELRPDWVVVQGDTSTTAMAGLAAFYAGVKVAHIEAGLRTHDLQNPFPEEANRRMVGIVADMHFAATDSAKKNLLREGVKEANVRVTGNTGIDALRLHCARIGLKMGGLGADAGQVRVLITAHRRENLETGIHDICQAVRAIADAHPDRFHFVWPVHPNPRVGEMARKALGGVHDVTLIPAVSYDRLLTLLSQCDIVLTDSGGLQEEAPSFGKPVLILREATERPEGVWAGVARLVGTNPYKIQQGIEVLANEIEAARAVSSDIPARISANPYGDGLAAGRIADFFAARPVQEFSYDPPAPAKIFAYNSGIRRSALHAIQ